MNKMLAATLALVSVMQLIQAECPNGCSGAGTCSPKDMCKCFKNYEGNDCSQRTCPFGNAHVDSPKGDLDNDRELSSVFKLENSHQHPEGTYEYRNPNAVDHEGHFYAECSNRGICGRETGECACFEGYDGSACQRTSCLNNCNNKGTCESIAEFATDRNGKLFHTSPAVLNDATYSLWDKKSSYGCKCDPGFFGPDCSQRHCKVGADPMFEASRTAIHDTVVIHYSVLASDNHIRIRYFDYWGESFITNRILWGTTVDTFIVNIKAALEALPNGVVKEVHCEEGKALGSRGELKALGPMVLSGGAHITIGCRFKSNAGKHRLPEIVGDSDTTHSKAADVFITRATTIGEDAEPTGLTSAVTVSTYDKLTPNALTVSIVAGTFELTIEPNTAVLLKVQEYYTIATGFASTTFTIETLDIPDIANAVEPLYYSSVVGLKSTNTIDVLVGAELMTWVANPPQYVGTPPVDLAVGDALFINQAFYIVKEIAGATVHIDRPYYGAADLSTADVYVWVGGIPMTDAITYVSECSGRGICETGSNGEDGAGVCQCFPGYTNDNCDTQNILAF